MFAILFSALNGLLGWIFRTVVLKFVIFFSFFFLVHAFIEVLVTWLPEQVDFISLFDLLPDSLWYFLNIFQISLGFNLLLTALITRFMIRRIPVIG